VTSREYRSRVREEGVRRTRAQIIDAARRLFLDRGYADTSVAAIAAAAGVSGQTVYNAFGTKADLLKHVYDVTLVGDDEPVPFAQRPEIQALLAEPDQAEFLRGYLGVGLVLLERLGPLLDVVRAGAAAGNADLVAHLRTVDEERLRGVTGMVRRLTTLGPLRAGVDPEQARDVIWSLSSVELWQLMVVRRGWSGRRWVEWAGQTAVETLLPPR